MNHSVENMIWVFLWSVFSPGGATVNSQGRKPLEQGSSIPFSPGGATVKSQGRKPLEQGSSIPFSPGGATVNSQGRKPLEQGSSIPFSPGGAAPSPWRGGFRPSGASCLYGIALTRGLHPWLLTAAPPGLRNTTRMPWS